MLSPRTGLGLGLEAKKLALASASMVMASASASRHHGLGLVSSGLVVLFIAMYLFHVLSQLATATAKSVINENQGWQRR